MRGRGWAFVAAAAVLAGVGVWTVRPADEAPPRAGCAPLRVADVREAPSWTREFARYGDDGARTDDWTGGDGTRSLRLPDGRTLWLHQDTFLDAVFGPARGASPAWVRNSAVLMDGSGRIERTLLGPGPSALFPGESTADGREVWRWPVAGVVEPRTPGSDEQVLRVLLWQREAGADPWRYGVPRATEVATLSLPGLRLEGITRVDAPTADVAPDRRVLYGTAALTHGGATYVYGADERGVSDGRASRAYVARVPPGALADPSAWRYWDGRTWGRAAARARPMESADAVTNSFGVTRHGGRWLLLTMDAGGPDGRVSDGLLALTACDPAGPWSAPRRVTTPPLPAGGARAGASAYNPQPHPEFIEAGGGDRLLVGYDVNVLRDPPAVHRDTALYRPRFLWLTVT